MTEVPQHKEKQEKLTQAKRSDIIINYVKTGVCRPGYYVFNSGGKYQVRRIKKELSKDIVAIKIERMKHKLESLEMILKLLESNDTESSDNVDIQ